MKSIFRPWWNNFLFLRPKTKMFASDCGTSMLKNTSLNIFTNNFRSNMRRRTNNSNSRTVDKERPKKMWKIKVIINICTKFIGSIGMIDNEFCYCHWCICDSWQHLLPCFVHIHITLVAQVPLPLILDASTRGRMVMAKQQNIAKGWNKRDLRAL